MPRDAEHDEHDEHYAHEALLAAAMLLAGKRVAVLTGAGISTESGIPDYRGPETAKRARRPMRFAEFTATSTARQRYWARATLGWPRVRDAEPNGAHHALARASTSSPTPTLAPPTSSLPTTSSPDRIVPPKKSVSPLFRVAGVITQNVDGLHGKAGSDNVIEVHGALRDVVCLGCDRLCSREDVHARTLAANPDFTARPAQIAPDGDVDIDDEIVRNFRVVACESCGGALKPRVVFFGENVPVDVVADAWRVIDEADALLVVGSSLEVFSGRRFVEEAHRRSLPIAIVNATSTRSDALATVVVRGRAGAIVPALVGRMPP